MPQFSFGSNQQPIKILDAGEGAWIVLQVLDASILFFDKTKDTLQTAGQGNIAPNATQGFQLKATDGKFLSWWEGPLWGRSDTVQGLINAAVVMRRKKCGGGCGGGSEQSEPGFDEGGQV